MHKEVPILGSVSYGRHFADLGGYIIGNNYRRLPYGEDVIEKLLECGDEPLMGRDNEIRLAVRMPDRSEIGFYTRRQICEKLPNRRNIIAEATGQLERSPDGNFGLIVNDNFMWLGKCDESLPTQAKLALLRGDVQISVLFPERQSKEHSFVRIECANREFGPVADLIHLDQDHKLAIINGLKLRKSSGD